MKSNGISSSSRRARRSLEVQVPVIARQGMGRKSFSRTFSVAALLVAEKVERNGALVVYGD